MLTRLVVASYAWLLEVALWIALAVAGVIGFNVTVPLMNFAGAVPAVELAWQIVGALLFPPLAFLALSILAGPALLLLDIRQAVRSIEAKLVHDQVVRGATPPERREPSI